jgi:hypothetical protein
VELADHVETSPETHHGHITYPRIRQAIEAVVGVIEIHRALVRPAVVQVPERHITGDVVYIQIFDLIIDMRTSVLHASAGDTEISETLQSSWTI